MGTDYRLRWIFGTPSEVNDQREQYFIIRLESTLVTTKNWKSVFIALKISILSEHMADYSVKLINHNLINTLIVLIAMILCSIYISLSSMFDIQTLVRS